MRAGVKKYQQAFQAEQGNKDEKLREELILKYAPLVKNIAERMAIRLPPNICKEELVGPGIMGLFDAIEKFDSSRQIKFQTYANLRIKGAILDELRKMDMISRSIRKNIHRIENAMRSLELKLGREPEDFEIAEEMGVDIDSYYKMTMKAQGAGLLSLDEIMPDGTTPKLSRQVSDTLSPFDKLKIKESKKIISKALSKLSKKEQLVMSLYYYDELTLKEIAKVLDLTESRISQIHSKIIIKLRIKLKSYYKD
ncbi:MAG: FliA/WhiG family RNA polymerase sigma factor [Deltaproteobacteria bacterium]|nr:FliA/WhiG family RNA polymerase sigma factor [Deltaproteobacteria bacterium]MBW2641052.1 FliA/WhiG family RNA polymerase sigma factor [Deltaproteobacteria bacterium]